VKHCENQERRNEMSAFEDREEACIPWSQKTKQLMELPLLKELPKDESDPRYVFSFGCSSEETLREKEIYEFFDEYGFVVIRDVFGEQQCQKTRHAMWEILEENNPGVNRNDPLTWNNMKGKGRYGLSIRGPSFHPTLIENRYFESSATLFRLLNLFYSFLFLAFRSLQTIKRQNPVLAKVLTSLTESRHLQNLLVSQDRFTVYRATRYLDPSVPGDLFSTGDRNLHLDCNPWWWVENASEILDGLDKTLQYTDEQDYIKENNLIVSSMGRHVQCVLNFANNVEEDGGTILIPYFHRYLQQWNAQHAASLRKPLPWLTLPKKIEEDLLSYSHRITMREGSVLIWDQRVLHGSAPNQSLNCRMAQYLKAFPRDLTYQRQTEEGKEEESSHPRLIKRSQGIFQRLKEDGNVGLVSEVGYYLFGLDVVSGNASYEEFFQQHKQQQNIK
jgi:ectoine hydroxylase-related dioxygenase (phytanoyl-CoA dioxygenase family)